MTLTKLLSNTGFILCLLGVAGIGGYFDMWTGLIASVTMLIMGIICLCLYIKEEALHEE